jgi:hypothetical protein
MSEQRCKNCKHWQNHLMTYRMSERIQHPYGVCQRIEHENQINDYRLDPESVLDEDPAYVEDGSDYTGALRTGPEFGCILWEANNDQA